jgi:hypothetical protein
MTSRTLLTAKTITSRYINAFRRSTPLPYHRTMPYPCRLNHHSTKHVSITNGTRTENNSYSRTENNSYRYSGKDILEYFLRAGVTLLGLVLLERYDKGEKPGDEGEVGEGEE